jgi:hypothetical protein
MIRFENSDAVAADAVIFYSSRFVTISGYDGRVLKK